MNASTIKVLNTPADGNVIALFSSLKPYLLIATGVVLGYVLFRILSHLTRLHNSRRAIIPFLYSIVTILFLAVAFPYFASKYSPVLWGLVKDGILIIIGGLLTPLVDSLRQFTTRSRRVAYIFRNDNSFHKEIWSGCRDQCNAYASDWDRKIHLDKFGDGNKDESLSKQVGYLRAINSTPYSKYVKSIVTNLFNAIRGSERRETPKRFDAVIIMSADPEQTNRHDAPSIEDFYKEIKRLINNGTVVISIDTKFNKSVFENDDHSFLGYVTSDYYSGGREVANRIDALARESGERDVAIILGSVAVVHEAVRQKEILYELFQREVRSDIISCPLDTGWDGDKCSTMLLNAITIASKKSYKKIIIYACDDNIALALSKKLAVIVDDVSKDRYAIIGYNGQRSGSEYIVANQPFVDSTVDTETFRQGALAFDFISECLYGNRRPNRRTKPTRPQLVIFPR